MSLNIASKVNVMGAIGKSIGYVVWAANGVLQLANKGVRKSYDLLANNKKYHVTRIPLQLFLLMSISTIRNP